jgi:hypothetical protein
MLETLRALAEALARDDASVSDLVARLGGSPTDHDANVIVEAPTLDGIARGNVVRDRPGDDTPAYLALNLQEPLTVKPLESRLGAPAEVQPDHPGQPVELVYPTPIADRPHAVTLIAASTGSSVILRRD